MASQISFHAKKSAVQIDFVAPKFNVVVKGDKKMHFIEKHGWIMIQMAMGDNKEYDWSEKLTFALSLADLPHIYKSFIDYRSKKGFNLSLVHDPNAGTDQKGKLVKTLRIQEGQNAGTFALTINYKSDGQDKRAFHYLNLGELKMLENYLNDMPSLMSGANFLASETA